VSRRRRMVAYRFCASCRRRYHHRNPARLVCRVCWRALKGHEELDRQWLERVREVA
jgi:hypothetical protein